MLKTAVEYRRSSMSRRELKTCIDKINKEIYQKIDHPDKDNNKEMIPYFSELSITYFT